MVLPPGSLCSLSRPQTFSSRPLQTKLMTHSGLFRPVPYLTAVSADKATASQQPPQAQLHRYHGLFRASFCLPVFSPGPELSQVDLTRPSSCLSLPSQGPAFASRPPSEIQLLFYSGLMSPSSDSRQPSQLLPLCRRPKCPQLQATKSRPKMSTSRPLKAPLLPFVGLSRPSCCPQVTSTGCAFTSGCAWRPNSCLRTTSFGSAPAQFLVAFEGPKVPQVKLS
uniref:uncharacterized protein LOC114677111 n=1 Tax=Macaca mulatta TaxID=9544 RepID=UPI0010A1FEF8|nr:uncharacterized protein LOC114677111 [Macaca mulatta]